MLFDYIFYMSNVEILANEVCEEQVIKKIKLLNECYFSNGNDFVKTFKKCLKELDHALSVSLLFGITSLVCPFLR